MRVGVYFTDFFGVSPKTLEDYGAFNISLINDLPLFIDPFNLFNSDKPEYQKLHQNIIRYVRFLKDKSSKQGIGPDLLESWYYFREVKQNWLGYCRTGNSGSGLAGDFAEALNRNLHTIFADFGSEEITRSSHLEKLCLVKDGVGRDNISDFTTNLIKGYLCEFTQAFLRDHIAPELRRRFPVERACFNYETESWQTLMYELPCFQGDFVLLTPKDLLTKDDTWINRADLAERLRDVADSIPDGQLRAQVNNYLLRAIAKLDKKEGKEGKEAMQEIAAKMAEEFPQILDFYIKMKEESGHRAKELSDKKVSDSELIFIRQLTDFISRELVGTAFYESTGNTYEEALARVQYLKHVIEDRDGYRIFYLKGKPIGTEEDLQILFILTWYATPSDLNREVNNGRGPVDFKISRGNRDKSLVEFKLARNKQLKRNLEKQVPIYEKSNDTKQSIKVIIYFSAKEHDRVRAILKDLNLEDNPSIVLIDGRSDNKPSGSTA